jgi:hypothetical protein
MKDSEGFDTKYSEAKCEWEPGGLTPLVAAGETHGSTITH